MDELDEILHPDYTINTPFRKTKGIDAVKESVTRMRVAMPYFYSTIEDIIVEGDRVACYIKWGGTHKGPLMRYPPTGKKVALDQIDMYRIDNGKVIERRVAGDRLSLLEQFGVASTRD